MDIIISSLHNGMNLRDEPITVEPGETGISVGCDFTKLGKITPLREGLEVINANAHIVWSEIRYIGNDKYYFFTTPDGLHYCMANDLPVVIDSGFTGFFKSGIVNNEYAVFMNAKYCKKWKPGWSGCHTWGLRTPSKPTVAAGTLISRTVDTFEDIGGYSSSGGGSGGATAADTVNYVAGTQSMKLTSDAGYTRIATDTVTYDFSYISISGDAGASDYFQFSFYPYNMTYVDSIRIKFSCEDGGGFTKDYYSYKLTIGGYIYATLAYSKGEAYPITDDIRQSFKLGAIDNDLVRTEYDPESKSLKLYTTVADTQDYSIDAYLGQPMDVGQTTEREVLTSIPITISQMEIKTQDRQVAIASTTWNTVKIPKSDFVRHGSTSGRDWSTITAVRFEVEAISGQAAVSFDQLLFSGGGNLWGYYWVAVAYQNALGNYGPYSSFAGPVFLESQNLAITNISVDTDQQTTARRFAILGGSISQPMVYTLSNNTDTTLTYNEKDSSLEQIETLFNNKPPVAGNDFEIAFGRVWIAGPANYENRVSYSEAGFFEAFPLRNYKSVKEGEQLKQVAMLSDSIKLRGTDREYTLQLVGANHATWRITEGAREGAVNNRMFLDLGAAHVYASPTGLYLSGGGVEGYYLQKINPAISSFSSMFGANTADKAYLYFKDTGGVDRVMRIDYSLGKPIAHYVANFKPSAIMADRVSGKIYYAYDRKIYQFEGGADPLPTSLVIPAQYGNTPKQKTFGPLMTYELDNGPLTMTFRTDRQSISGTYTLPTAEAPGEPVCLPNLIGGGLEITLSSTTQDYTLYLPILIEAQQVER